jgi:hypothetical protein
MDHYNYPKHLKAIWNNAVAKYEAGHQKPENFLDDATLTELATCGLNVMDVFDYAEDFVDGGDPSFENFLTICEARRDYFLTKQKGQLSDKRLDSSTLPAKDSEARGIAWTPRIIQKALSKLRGELPTETMYNCGGDRRFLKANNIHPAEFLRVVWAYEDDHEKIIDWIEARKAATLNESPS